MTTVDVVLICTVLIGLIACFVDKQGTDDSDDEDDNTYGGL